MDVGTGLALFGSAKLVEKLLGPTASYIGEGIKTWTTKRIDNVKRIFANATEKLGDKIELKGHIPPRVLKEILDEGSYSDDFISIEYFGGVLASSRTGIDRDDRGKYFASIVSRLSTYQLRAHYIFYHIIKKIFNGEELNIGVSEDRDKMQIFVSMVGFEKAMDITEEEGENFDALLQHCITGLVKEELIGNYYSFGDADFMKKQFKDTDAGGIIMRPSSMGVQLFLWVYGQPNLVIQDIINPDHVFKIDEKVNLDNGFYRTYKKEEKHDEKK